MVFQIHTLSNPARNNVTRRLRVAKSWPQHRAGEGYINFCFMRCGPSH